MSGEPDRLVDLSWQQWLTENIEPLAHPIDPGVLDPDPANVYDEEYEAADRENAEAAFEAGRERGEDWAVGDDA